MNESETEYRKRIQVIFDRIEKAMESVDPDVAECDQSQGALTIVLSDGSRCILSAQPSVRQLWLALAKDGIAYHFNFDPTTQSWRDDKGKGVELVQFMEAYLSRAVHGKIIL